MSNANNAGAGLSLSLLRPRWRCIIRHAISETFLQVLQDCAATLMGLLGLFSSLIYRKDLEVGKYKGAGILKVKQ
jgi:hypothetical protein